MQLMSESVSQYLRDGYCIAKCMLPPADIGRVFADMHRLVAQQLRRLGLPWSHGATEDAVHEDLRRLFSQDLSTYLATLTLCAKLVSLYDLYLLPQVRSFAAAIGIDFPVFQTAPVLHLMSNSLKVPGGYQGLGAHQDWPTLQGGLDTVTIWIPFLDVDRDCFTMEIIPGSHKGGLQPYARREHFFEVDPDHYDAEDFVPMETTRGDIVFMSSFAIHRSSLRGNDRLRVATSMRYENASEPHFIDRSYPFAQRRSVTTDLITPGFPRREQVQALFEAPSLAANASSTARSRGSL